MSVRYVNFCMTLSLFIFLLDSKKRKRIHYDKHDDREEVEPHRYEQFASNLVDHVLKIGKEGPMNEKPDVH